MPGGKRWMSMIITRRGNEPRRCAPGPFPHPSGGRGKKRPVVVVQADAYNQTLRTLVVAEVTKNLKAALEVP